MGQCENGFSYSVPYMSFTLLILLYVYLYVSITTAYIGDANPFLRFCLSGIELQRQAQCYVTTKRCKGNLHAVRAVRVACVDCEAHSDYYRG